LFRDLLVHVDGSQAGRRRVQLAVDLAGRMDARLSGLHATPPAEVPLKYKPSRLAEVAAHVSARLELDARAAAAIFREEAPDACWLEASGDVVLHVSDEARYADLVILGYSAPLCRRWSAAVRGRRAVRMPLLAIGVGRVAMVIW
jgi:nucleotide-binding universal stress UspA family protein